MQDHADPPHYRRVTLPIHMLHPPAGLTIIDHPADARVSFDPKHDEMQPQAMCLLGGFLFYQSSK